MHLSRAATDRSELLAGLKDSVLAVRLAAAERLTELPGDSVKKEALPVLQEAVRAGGVEAVAAFALLARLANKRSPRRPKGRYLAVQRAIGRDRVPGRLPPLSCRCSCGLLAILSRSCAAWLQ